eukprot:1494804-Amphidinium_carterae.1
MVYGTCRIRLDLHPSEDLAEEGLCHLGYAVDTFLLYEVRFALHSPVDGSAKHVDGHAHGNQDLLALQKV